MTELVSRISPSLFRKRCSYFQHVHNSEYFDPTTKLLYSPLGAISRSRDLAYTPFSFCFSLIPNFPRNGHLLREGATSNVFRAVHAATLKMIALKEVSVSTDADRRAVRTEMRALRTQRSPLLTSTFTTELASCPRIVDYYGSIVRENGNACIAVEYVAGGSLGSWLDNGLRCPEAWIAHIAHQALEVSQDLLMLSVVMLVSMGGCH